ncbi:MAG: sugar transporter [Hyphomicrobiales bacterium]|nr:sugar transporter [Hyphomicrobiales bacterium]
MKVRLFINSVLLAALTLGGCSTPQMRPELFEAHASAPYRLAAGDRLRIIVFGQDSLSNSYSVDGSGRISMPLIGVVDAFGLSATQLERVIESKLRGGYLREPRVAVEVEAYRPFFMLGEVTAAGQYPYINGMTVQNAVAVSGGFSARAQRSWVEMTRIIDGTPVTSAVPLTQSILPGDTITVRERYF